MNSYSWNQDHAPPFTGPPVHKIPAKTFTVNLFERNPVTSKNFFDFEAGQGRAIQFDGTEYVRYINHYLRPAKPSWWQSDRPLCSTKLVIEAIAAPTKTSSPPIPVIYAFVPNDAAFNSGNLGQVRQAVRLVSPRVRFEQVDTAVAAIIALSNKGLEGGPYYQNHSVLPRFFDSDPRGDGWYSCKSNNKTVSPCETQNNGGRRWALPRIAEMAR